MCTPNQTGHVGEIHRLGASRSSAALLINARTGHGLRSYQRLTTSLLAGDAPFH
jgi:hypothetical protein